MESVLEQVTKKYNYEYNYFEGYSYNHPTLPTISIGGYADGKFSIIKDGKFIAIQSLEEFEKKCEIPQAIK